MNTLENNNWSTANQQYITGMIGLIKTQLEWYARNPGNNIEDQSAPQNINERASLEKLAAEMPAPPAIERLVEIFSLSTFERDILIMCAAMELDAGFAELIATLQGEQSFFQPSFGLALAAWPAAHWSAVSPGGALRYWRLIEVNKAQLITRSPLKIDEHILHYIAGIPELNEKLKEMAVPVYADEEPVPSQLKLANTILQTISQNPANALLPLIHLTGNDLSDKMTTASYISTSLQSQLFIIPAYDIPTHTKDNMELARLWSREAILNRYTLFIDCAELDSNDKPKLQSLISFMEKSRDC